MKLSKVVISNPHEFDICNQPVSTGVPFPVGLLIETADLCLVDQNNQTVGHAARVLSRWPDGSARWVLIEMLASVNSGQQITLDFYQAEKTTTCQGSNASHTADDDGLTDPGVFEFAAEGIGFCLESGTGQVLATAHREGSSESDILSSRLELVDVSGTRHSLPVIAQSWTYDPSGQSAVIKTQCEFRRVPESLATKVSVEQKVFAHTAFSRVEICLHNPNAALHPGGIWDLGDPGSLCFRSCALVLEGSAEVLIKWQIAAGDTWQSSDHDQLSIVQASSGGENWQSPVHVDAHGCQTLAFRGYRVHEQSVEVAAGNRCEPSLMIDSGDFQTIVRPQDFWQCFPNALRVSGREIRVECFPEFDGIEHELQGGESSTSVCYLDFSSKADALGWVDHPLYVNLEPATVFSSRALLDWQQEARDIRFSALLDKGLEGENSFFRKREIVDEYGWRHFGELYADHETWNQSPVGIFVSHYNNQYDPVYGFARQYLQTGDYRYYELMNDLARHVLDIDLYRTERDRPEYNHGLFWHTDHYVQAHTATHRTYSRKQNSEQHTLTGGGPGGQHCYTSGLRLYYQLTGNSRARQAVFDMTRWLGFVYEGTGSILEQARASLTRDLPIFLRLLKGQKVLRYRYPLDRGIGNYIRALLDCFELDGDKTHLDRIAAIIRETVGPFDDIEERDLANIELTWVFTIFLQAVVAFLDTKRAMGELDTDFHYARSSLLHYVNWMLIHERPYLESSDKLEYPNDTWVAQDTRKAALFYAAYRYSLDNREALLAKAIYFKNYVVDMLEASDTLHYTRIQVILLQNHGPLGSVWAEQPPFNCDLIPIHDNKDAVTTIWSHTCSCAAAWWRCLCTLSVTREAAWLKHRFPQATRKVDNR